METKGGIWASLLLVFDILTFEFDGSKICFKAKFHTVVIVRRGLN